MPFVASITNVAEILSFQPLIASASYITSAQIIGMAGQEEAKIWSKLGARYTVPIFPVPPVVLAVAIDLTCYALLSKQALLSNTLNDSPWPKAYKAAEELLEALASGEAAIITASGTVIGESSAQQIAWSSAGDGYKPTMVELPTEHLRVDPDLEEDLLDERST
jgi:phage gp36-like protein